MSDDHQRSHVPPWRVTSWWWVPLAALAVIAGAGLTGAVIP